MAKRKSQAKVVISDQVQTTSSDSGAHVNITVTSSGQDHLKKVEIHDAGQDKGFVAHFRGRWTNIDVRLALRALQRGFHKLRYDQRKAGAMKGANHE
jgi:hypothetical protein